MNVLVVGGAGFIGSHLVDRLLADGHAVDVVDDYSTGSLANLASARAVDGELKVHHFDVGAPPLVDLLARRRPDVIFHLAAVPRRVTSDTEYAAAFRNTIGLLEAARAARVGKIVVPLPASCMYGRPDNRSLPVKEQDPEPLGVRGIVARSTVDALHQFRDESALEYTVLALANVYGSRQRPTDGVIAAMIDAAAHRSAPVIAGDGRQTRDFVFIDDTVDALARCTDRGGGLIINIGTGEQTVVGELWEMIGGANRLTPTTIPPSPHHLQRFAVSPVRARLQLGWAYWTPLPEGISATRTRN